MSGSNSWLRDVKNTVISRIKDEFPNGTLKKYKMTLKDNFSSVSSSTTPSALPFVCIQLLPISERGQDLEGKTINAGFFTFQIDVTSKKPEITEDIAYLIMEIMKNMSFTTASFPDTQSSIDTYRCTARYSRVIGQGDVF